MKVPCINLKGAYFVVTTAITLLVIGGGLSIVILNNDAQNVAWAQQLIGMIVTLWVPSPAENLKDAISSTPSVQVTTPTTTDATAQKIIIHDDDDVELMTLRDVDTPTTSKVYTPTTSDK